MRALCKIKIHSFAIKSPVAISAHDIHKRNIERVKGILKKYLAKGYFCDKVIFLVYYK